jgi:hypothetical protein
MPQVLLKKCNFFDFCLRNLRRQGIFHRSHLPNNASLLIINLVATDQRGGKNVLFFIPERPHGNLAGPGD